MFLRTFGLWLAAVFVVAFATGWHVPAIARYFDPDISFAAIMCISVVNGLCWGALGLFAAMRAVLRRERKRGVTVQGQRYVPDVGAGTYDDI